MADIKINFPTKCIPNQDDENEFFKMLVQKLKEHLTTTLQILPEKISIQRLGLAISVKIDSNTLLDQDLGNNISAFIENYDDPSIVMGKTIKISTPKAYKMCFIGHC